MIPGEYRLASKSIHGNKNRNTLTIRVLNTGDRPIQVGSHFHFFEVNRFLAFSRQTGIGKHLNIPSGTAVRFEPGEETEVELVEMGGTREVFGLNNLTNGSISHPEELTEFAESKGFKGEDF